MPLPQEVVDNIFDYLKYSTQSLRKGSLVCHSWKRSAWRHIHSTLNLFVYHHHSEHEPGVFTLNDEGGLLVKYGRYVDIVKQNPEIAACVKNVHIHYDALTENPRSRDPTQLVRWRYSEEASLDPIYEEYAEPLLSAFTAVQEVVLTTGKNYNIAGYGLMHFSDIPDALLAGVKDLLARSTRKATLLFENFFFSALWQPIRLLDASGASVLELKGVQLLPASAFDSGALIPGLRFTPGQWNSGRSSYTLKSLCLDISLGLRSHFVLYGTPQAEEYSISVAESELGMLYLYSPVLEAKLRRFRQLWYSQYTYPDSLCEFVPSIHPC